MGQVDDMRNSLGHGRCAAKSCEVNSHLLSASRQHKRRICPTVEPASAKHAMNACLPADRSDMLHVEAVGVVATRYAGHRAISQNYHVCWLLVPLASVVVVWKGVIEGDGRCNCSSWILRGTFAHLPILYQ
jgi:hypothetical protein